jgi:hypothetical protein
MAIQGTPVVALQEQPGGAWTWKVWLDVSAGRLTLTGLTVVLEAQMSAWLMVRIRPAAVIVPDRLGPEFAATSYVTRPFPFPLEPETIDIQPSLEFAVHGHPVPVRTSTVWPAAPDATTFALGGARPVLEAQPSPCCTVKTRSPTLIVPVRDGPVFADTL